MGGLFEILLLGPVPGEAGSFGFGGDSGTVVLSLSGALESPGVF